MDPMVLKYVGLTAVVYGFHLFLSFAQLALGIFLVANGILLLGSKIELSTWSARFGLRLNEQMRQNPINGWLMIATGVAFLLPVFGMPYWLTIIACVIAVYWLAALSGGEQPWETKKRGGFVRKGLIASAILVLGFTVWEGRDLVKAGFLVAYKAYYWNEKEVNGWQQTNNPNVPKVGELPPDFELTDVHGENSVRLSEFRGNTPVVLLFGSFT